MPATGARPPRGPRGIDVLFGFAVVFFCAGLCVAPFLNSPTTLRVAVAAVSALGAVGLVFIWRSVRRSLASPASGLERD